MSRIDPHHHHVPGQQPLGRVAILGLGLIGGSLGQVLSAVGAAEEVIGWDIDPETITAATASGTINKVVGRPQDAVTNADLVVLCVPVDQVVPLLTDISPYLLPTAIVTDVAGTKSRIVAEAERIVGGRFIGSHPMAGSEESGFSASSVDLFDAAVWLLTPTPRTGPRAVDLVSRMADWCGATARICSPEQHDHLVGYLSHLPHLLAFGLAAAAGQMVDPEYADAAAGSFKGSSRVALSNPEHWAKLLMDNKIAAAIALKRHREWTGLAEQALESGNIAALQVLLVDAHEARKRFPR